MRVEPIDVSSATPSPRRGLIYLGLAYAFSWAWWLPLALTGTVTKPGQAWPTHLPGLLGPALAAITATALLDGKAGLRRLGTRVLCWQVTWYWYALIVITAAFALLPLAVGSDSSISDYLTYSGAGQWGAMTVLYVLLLNGFGEEVGWRGFLVSEMLRGHSLIDAAVRIWVVWGLWHLPLFFVVQNFKDLGVGGTIGWAVGLLCGSIWLTWLYQRAGQSILLVALWHTAFNFSTATAAAAGLPAAVASTLVMVAAGVIAFLPSSRRGPQ